MDCSAGFAIRRNEKIIQQDSESIENIDGFRNPSKREQGPHVEKYCVYTYPYRGVKKELYTGRKKNIPCFGKDKEWPKVNFLRVSETRNPETRILPYSYKEWPQLNP